MAYIPQHYPFPVRLKHRLEYALLRFGSMMINLLPLAVVERIGRLLSWLVWCFIPYRLPVAYENLTTLFPEKSHREKLRLARSAYRQFIKASGLIFIIHRPRIRRMIEQASISGLEHLDRALADNRGVILTTYHGCWFEGYFAWFSRNSRPTSLIYKRQKNPRCDAFFVKLRQRYGSNLRHVDKYEKLARYQQELSENRLLIISLDQNYTDNGTPVRFFGQEFSCARGTALLHLKTGAPVFTSVYYLKQGRLHIDFEPVPLPRYQAVSDQLIQDLTSRCLAPYEKTVAAYPDQWFSLFHRLWKKSGYPRRIPRTLRERFLIHRR